MSEQAPEAEAVLAPVEAAAAARPALHGAERGEEVLLVAPEGDHGAQGPQIGGGGVSVALKEFANMIDMYMYKEEVSVTLSSHVSVSYLQYFRGHVDWGSTD